MATEPTATSLLCVDQDKGLLEQLQRLLGAQGSRVVWEKRQDKVLEHFEQESFAALVLTGAALRQEVDQGLELLEVITADSPATQIILLVHPRDLKLAAKALKAGGYHYGKLPVSDEELGLLLDAALARRPQFGPNMLLKGEAQRVRFEEMVGGSPPMREVYRLIRQAASTDIPVLLTGETGTGKDVAALAVHQLSSRSEARYYPVHLGALPEDLVAGELFGHEKGAFTGALERRLGCFELAHQGTVFLDEITTMDEKMQVSLLRLLEDNRLHRIGGSRSIKVDVRIIAASNENLEEAVAAGRFREDLYYRLEVMSIRMPPLKERHGDVPLLVDHFLKRFNTAYDKHILGVSPEVLALMESFPWPGNVRELKNVINRAVVLCNGEVLLPEHLPQRIRQGAGGRPMVAVPVGSTLEDMEKEMVARTLVYTGGNRTRAADLLGISRRALYNKLDRFNL